MLRFPKKTVRDIPLDGGVVLLRADYNVPINASGQIDDDYRLRMSLPTLNYLLGRDCKIVVIAHLGRPEGRINAKYSLEIVAKKLSELLGNEVEFVDSCIGDRVIQEVKKLKEIKDKNKKILLLENLRFHKEEEENDKDFAKKLARDSGADYFVQDGFGVVHRAHASTSAITNYLPSVAGLLVEKEWLNIEGAINDPAKPLVAVLGGAKISDKIGMIERFIDKSDQIIIGGAMANIFLKYHGYEVGTSLVESGLDDEIKRIYKLAEDKVGLENVDNFIILPVDVVIGNLDEDGNIKRQVVDLNNVKKSDKILDLGDKSIIKICNILIKSRTVIWNGTLGYAEIPRYALSSMAVANTLAKHPEITSVIGGGDTADFVLKWDNKKGDSFTNVSTGGGASLELMSGLPMPGIDSLMDV
jgi:phosphoglycerate kinase